MRMRFFPPLANLIVCGASLLAIQFAVAQNNNPTGNAGYFNGNSTVGCSYDPFTANATRTIPDITVSGAVGGYPLAWARTMNSRSPGGPASLFGQGGAWRHSYAWSIDASEEFTTATPGNPTYYAVNFPDGTGSQCEERYRWMVRDSILWNLLQMMWQLRSPDWERILSVL